MKQQSDTNVVEQAPAPTAAPAAADQELTPREIKRNMVLSVLSSGVGNVGNTDLHIVYNPLMNFLGASNTIVGLVNNMSFLIMFGTLVAPYISPRFRRKKWLSFFLGLPGTLMFALLAILIIRYTSLGISKPQMLLVVLGCLGGQILIGGFASVPAFEFGAAIIPMSHRGRMVGLNFAASTATAFIALPIGYYLIESIGEPANYGWTLAISVIIILLGGIFVLFAKERPTPIERAARGWNRDSLSRAWNDKGFRNLMIFVLFQYTLFGPIWTFVRMYGLRDLHMEPKTSAIMDSVVMIFRFATLFTGYMGDRIGVKRMLPWGYIVCAAGLFYLVQTRTPMAVYICLAMYALGISVIQAATVPLYQGVPKPENRTVFFSIYMILSQTVTTIGALLTGGLCDHFSYITIFWVWIGVMFFLCFISYRLTRRLPDDIRAYG